MWARFFWTRVSENGRFQKNAALVQTGQGHRLFSMLLWSETRTSVNVLAITKADALCSIFLHDRYLEWCFLYWQDDFHLCFRTCINFNCLLLRENQIQRHIPSLVKSSSGCFWYRLSAVFPWQHYMSTAGKGNLETNTRSSIQLR